MPYIEVIRPGNWSTVQDTGRTGWQHLGVPISGAMDSCSAQQANLLVGNNEADAVLEITLSGPELRFSEEAMIALTGADLSAKLEGEELPLYRPYRIRKGQVLSFGKRRSGAREYLAVAGGIQSESVMESRSWFSPITASQRLQAGDRIPFLPKNAKVSGNFASLVPPAIGLRNSALAAYPGPEFEMFPKESLSSLESKIFTVSPANSRMGYQLEEAFLPHDLSIRTSAVLPGTVQLTPAGKLIILMRDCQTTGGYPRLLQLDSKSIDRVAQLTTGDSLRFKIKELA